MKILIQTKAFFWHLLLAVSEITVCSCWNTASGCSPHCSMNVFVSSASSVASDSFCLGLVFLTVSHQQSFETFFDFIAAQPNDESSALKKWCLSALYRQSAGLGTDSCWLMGEKASTGPRRDGHILNYFQLIPTFWAKRWKFCFLLTFRSSLPADFCLCLTSTRDAIFKVPHHEGDPEIISALHLHSRRKNSFYFHLHGAVEKSFCCLLKNSPKPLDGRKMGELMKAAVEMGSVVAVYYRGCFSGKTFIIQDIVMWADIFRQHTHTHTHTWVHVFPVALMDGAVMSCQTQHTGCRQTAYPEIFPRPN